MNEAPQPARAYRFGVFEVDLASEELRKHGLRLRVQGQPFQILVALLERPGEVVTREQLRQRLWPDGTFVEFDQNLNTAVNRLREALSDDADAPRFIETLSRRGYRFVAPVAVLDRYPPGASSPERAVAGAEVRRPFPLAWVALATTLMVVTATALLVNRSSNSPPHFQQLTFSGYDWGPSASPDGKVVAFVSRRDGVERIWLKHLGSGEEVPLTEGRDIAPRFSPDGSNILFSHQEGTEYSVYRVSVFGGEPRRVIEHAWQADWSPDGSKIVAIPKQEVGGILRSRLVVAASDGSNVRQLKDSEQVDLRSPRWSPDGRWIATVSNRISLYSADGSTMRMLKPAYPGGYLSAVAWVPDGNALIYVQPESPLADTNSPMIYQFWLASTSSARVVRQDVSSGQASVLCWLPSNVTTADILPDGRLLVDAVTPKHNLVEVGLRPSHLLGRETLLTRGSSIDRQPVYAPNGKSVLFTSNRGGNFDVWQLSLQTGVLRQLTTDKADDWDPAYSRDGKHILWSSNRTGHFEIWMSEREGSHPRKISHDGINAQNPTVASDGQFLFYVGDEDRKLRESGWERSLWRIRPDGSGKTRILNVTAGWPEVSPDGRYLLHGTVETPKGGPGFRMLRVVRLPDGEPVSFEIPVAGGGSGRARWMPDSRAIAFIEKNEAGVTGIFVQDFVPGKDTRGTRRPIAGFDPQVQVESFGIFPDGRRLIISASEEARHLMVVDGPALRAKRRN